MSDEQTGDRVPSAGRYIAVGVIALVVAALVIVYLVSSGTDGEKDAASGPSDTGGLSAGGSSTTSTSQSTSTQSTAQPSTPSSTAPSTPPSSTSTAPTQSAPVLSDQPALPPMTGIEVVVTSSAWLPDAQSIQVVAAVAGVATQSGSCTATAVSGAESASASVAAVFDGRGTSCGTITIPMQGKPAGDWQVTVAFTYDSGSASSIPTAVKVG